MKFGVNARVYEARIYDARIYETLFLNLLMPTGYVMHHQQFNIQQL
jgi:hypothetical protein